MRNELAKSFKGIGVEIGVERGHFSKVILQYCDKLYAIDAWQTYSKYREHVTQERLDAFYEETKERLKNFNCEIIRKFSSEAVKDFEDESLDFVYIDANHSYESVKEDIELWKPKVKIGGILAGHDYMNVPKREGIYGVIKAVDELLPDREIIKGDKSPSWLWIKP